MSAASTAHILLPSFVDSALSFGVETRSTLVAADVELAAVAICWLTVSMLETDSVPAVGDGSVIVSRRAREGPRWTCRQGVGDALFPVPAVPTGTTEYRNGLEKPGNVSRTDDCP